MNEIIVFLDALKKEFPNLFEVKDGAPIAEFWESFEAAYQAAQQMLAPDSLKAGDSSLPESVKVENALPAESG
mgnify:CR=1 FL=1